MSKDDLAISQQQLVELKRLRAQEEKRRKRQKRYVQSAKGKSAVRCCQMKRYWQKVAKVYHPLWNPDHKNYGRKFKELKFKNELKEWF